MIGVSFLKAAAGLLLLFALVACDDAVPKPTDESAGSSASASPTVIQFEIPTGGNGRASSVAALPLGSDAVERLGKLVPVKAAFPDGFTHSEHPPDDPSCGVGCERLSVHNWTLSKAAPEASQKWIDDGGVAVWTWSVDETSWHAGLTVGAGLVFVSASGLLVPGRVDFTLSGCADFPVDDSELRGEAWKAHNRRCVADNLRSLGGTTLYVRVRLLDP